MNSLIHADCLSIEGMQSIDDKSIDLIVTDPPYSFPTNQFRPEARIKQKSFTDFSTYQHFFKLFLTEATRVVNDDGDVYVFCDEVFYAVLYPLFYSQFYSTKMLIWDKCRIGMGGIWRRQFEVILHGRLRPAKFKSGDGDIIKCKPVRKKIHQSQKPVELIEKLVGKNKFLDGTVLDCFAGSMTTAIACINLKRSYICIEKDKDIFDKGKARVTERLNQLELNLTTPARRLRE